MTHVFSVTKVRLDLSLMSISRVVVITTMKVTTGEQKQKMKLNGALIMLMPLRLKVHMKNATLILGWKMLHWTYIHTWIPSLQRGGLLASIKWKSRGLAFV